MPAKRREVRRVEYVLPSGADAHELQDTLRDAAQYLRELGGLHPGSEIPADSITVHARDGELVVEFQVVVDDGEPLPEGVPVHGFRLWGPDGPPTFPVPPAEPPPWMTGQQPEPAEETTAAGEPDNGGEVTGAPPGEELEPVEADEPEPEPATEAPDEAEQAETKPGRLSGWRRRNGVATHG